MKKLKKNLLILPLISVLSLVGCSEKNNTDPLSRTELFMGTVVKISLYDNQNEAILTEAFDRIEEIESLVSINEADSQSELDKVNASAGIEAVKVSETTFNIVEKGIEFSKLSNGSFDITVGPLVKLWSIGLEGAKVPTLDEINSVLPLIDYTDVELNKDDSTIFLKNSGMIIDLGSIAKGYAADEVSKILTENNVTSAIIDLGGNIYAHGIKPSGDDWKIGIQNPFNDRGSILGVLEVKDKTVVTSGIYERYLEDDGTKYHHLLDPKTGYPFDNEIVGISIIADKSVDADALSTTTFSKGLVDGFNFIESLDNVDAIFIDKDYNVYLTDGIKNFEIDNSDFKLSSIK